jgi:DNA topoisomerase VI subunit B
LTNSIKYTPNNGLIELKCEISRDNHSFVEISLKDNGIGIRKDKINTIFNKFNQIIAKDSGHARSTGLGLTFCKMAVEAHNGEINVISEPGVFTEFNFKIPVSDNVSVQNKQTIISDTVIKINLDKSEKEYLMNFIKDLEKTEVYDIGKLRILTKKIDNRFSKNINSWKKELNNSIYNCNFEYYNELIKTAKMNDDEA